MSTTTTTDNWKLALGCKISDKAAVITVTVRVLIIAATVWTHFHRARLCQIFLICRWNFDHDRRSSGDKTASDFGRNITISGIDRSTNRLRTAASLS